MKTILVIPFLFFTLLSFGQKRLIAKSEVKHNQVGTIHSIDSASYFYSSWYNSLSEFKPIFRHPWGFSFKMPDWEFDFKVHCDSAMLYQSASYPPYYKSSTYNVITDGLMRETKVNTNLEYHYAYNPAGLETLSVTNWAGSVNDSTFRTYDSFGNETSMTQVPFENSTIPNFGASFIDSSFYIPNTHLLEKRTTYKHDATTNSYFVVDHWELEYDGTNIDFIDHFKKDGNGGTFWSNRIVYDYIGGLQKKQTTYTIQGDSLAYILNQEEYEYGIKGDLIKVLRTQTDDFDTSSLILLRYEDVGFVKEKNVYWKGSSDSLFLAQSFKYYYESKNLESEGKEVFTLLHPNPVEDELTIQTSSNLIRVEIVNLQGQIVLSQKSKVIDVKGLSPGEYYVHGITENGDFSEAFIKK